MAIQVQDKFPGGGWGRRKVNKSENSFVLFESAVDEYYFIFFTIGSRDKCQAE